MENNTKNTNNSNISMYSFSSSPSPSCSPSDLHTPLFDPSTQSNSTENENKKKTVSSSSSSSSPHFLYSILFSHTDNAQKILGIRHLLVFCSILFLLTSISIISLCIIQYERGEVTIPIPSPIPNPLPFNIPINNPTHPPPQPNINFSPSLTNNLTDSSINPNPHSDTNLDSITNSPSSPLNPPSIKEKEGDTPVLICMLIWGLAPFISCLVTLCVNWNNKSFSLKWRKWEWNMMKKYTDTDINPFESSSIPNTNKLQRFKDLEKIVTHSPLLKRKAKNLLRRYSLPDEVFIVMERERERERNRNKKNNNNINNEQKKDLGSLSSPPSPSPSPSSPSPSPNFNPPPPLLLDSPPIHHSTMKKNNEIIEEKEREKKTVRMKREVSSGLTNELEMGLMGVIENEDEIIVNENAMSAIIEDNTQQYYNRAAGLFAGIQWNWRLRMKTFKPSNTIHNSQNTKKNMNQQSLTNNNSPINPKKKNNNNLDVNPIPQNLPNLSVPPSSSVLSWFRWFYHCFLALTLPTLSAALQYTIGSVSGAYSSYYNQTFIDRVQSLFSTSSISSCIATSFIYSYCIGWIWDLFPVRSSDWGIGLGFSGSSWVLLGLLEELAWCGVVWQVFLNIFHNKIYIKSNKNNNNSNTTHHNDNNNRNSNNNDDNNNNNNDNNNHNILNNNNSNNNNIELSDSGHNNVKEYNLLGVYVYSGLCTGLLWSSWHWSFILFGGYGFLPTGAVYHPSGIIYTPTLYAFFMFTVRSLFSRLIICRLLFLYPSVWIAALFHAQHNVMVFNYFPQLPTITINNRVGIYLVGECGFVVVLCYFLITLCCILSLRNK